MSAAQVQNTVTLPNGKHVKIQNGTSTNGVSAGGVSNYTNNGTDAVTGYGEYLHMESGNKRPTEER